MWRAKRLTTGLTRLGASTTLSRRCLSNDKIVPSSAEVVITGGGVLGTSIAFHLSQLGWKDIVVLEQGSVGCGTSWHAAGLVGSLRGTIEQTTISQYALNLFERFEEEYGIGFRRCGSLYLAQTQDRVLQLLKSNERAREFNIMSNVLKPEEINSVNPYLRTDDLMMGIHLPNDAVVNPTDLVQAYVKEATKDGAAKVIEGVKVTKISSEGRRVTEVESSAGNIKCQYFINAAGLWSRELGMRSNPIVEVPSHPCQHFYVVTKPMDIDIMMPVTRDYDSHLYFREFSGGVLCGGFEPGALSCFYERIPEKFEFQLLEENWDHFSYLMGGILNRYPDIKNTGIRQFVNGPESFSPDVIPFICKSIEFDNYYITSVMSSIGIVGSAGVGKIISELMTYGESPLWNPYRFDVRRMPSGSNNKYLNKHTAPASLSNAYGIPYPINFSSPDSRLVKTSPLYQRLKDDGAIFSSISNWQVPMYFAKKDQDPPLETFGKPCWLDNVQEELKTCEEDVAVVDLSMYSMFQVMVKDGTTLSTILKCPKDLDSVASGSCFDTILLGKDGNGCIAKVTLLKESSNKVTIFTKPYLHKFLLSWLRDKQSELPSIEVSDMSGRYGCIGMLGNRSKNLLQELVSPPHHQCLPEKNSYKVLDIGFASEVILLPSLMEVPEGDTWRMIVPIEYMQGLYHLLKNFDEKYKVSNIGHLALKSLRVRNFIADCPSEVKIQSKKQFLENLYTNEQHNNTEEHIALMEITLKDDNNWPWEGEPIVTKEELKVVGHVTSVGYTKGTNKLNVIALMKEKKENIILKVGASVYEVNILDVK